MIAFIQKQEVIRKVLPHPGLRPIKARPRQTAHAPAADLTHELFNGWPAPSAEGYPTDPTYPCEI